MYRGGLTFMRHSVSDTAEHGDYTGGPRVIGPAVRDEMRRMLAEIQDGRFARAWIDENRRGRPEFLEARRRERSHPIEQVGAKLRSLMSFLDPPFLLDADPITVVKCSAYRHRAIRNFSPPVL